MKVRQMKPPTYSKQLQVAYIQNIRKHKPCPAQTAFLTLTYQCQCKCVHCGIALYKQKKKKELTYNEIIILIDEIRKLGVNWVYFFGGEPLLVSQLTEYIKHATQQGLKVRIDTNGFLLDKDMVKKLKGAGVDLICVSIDSPFKNIHDKLRGVKGIFKRAVRGIEYCRKYNLECHLSTYATKKNLKNGDLKKTINLAKRLGVPIRILSPILMGRWLNRNDLVLSGKEIKLLRSLLKENKVYWENELIDQKEVSFFCVAMNRFIFYISAYGDVQPCSFFPLSFGNIREEPLDDILERMWTSEMFTQYRDSGRYDCLFHDKAFMQKYKLLIESKDQLPKRYKNNRLRSNVKRETKAI